MRKLETSLLRSTLGVVGHWRRLPGIAASSNRRPTLVLSVAISVLWTLVLYRYGIGLSPDGVMYLKTASFMRYNGDFNTLVTVWPPLYPFIVSLFLFVTPFPAAAAALAAGALLFATLLSMVSILRDILNRPFLELWIFLALLCLPCFWLPFYKAYSEAAFACFCLAHLYFVRRYLDTKRLGFFGLAAAAASLSALSRYSGYALFACFGLLGGYAFVVERSPKKRAVISAAVLGAMLPSLLWIIRNHYIDQSFHGIRGSSRSTIFEGIHKLVVTVNQALGYPLLMLLVGCVAFLAYRVHLGLSTRKPASPLLIFEQYTVGVLVSYPGLIIYATATADINAIGDRLVHPLYPVSFVLIAAGIRQLRDFVPTRNLEKAAALGCVALLVIGVATRIEPLTATFSRLSRIDKSQTDYFSVGFEKSRNAEQMARQMTRIIAGNRTILLAGIVNIPSYRMYRGHGYFYRRHLWSSPNISGFGLDNIRGENIAHSRRYNYQACDFNATFTYKGEPRTVLYRGVPEIKRFERIAAHFRKEMKRHHVPRAFVLESKALKGRKWGVDMARGIASANTGGVEVTTLVSNSDFAIHRFVLGPVPGDDGT